MAGQGNARPVIIKRKKVIAGGGHHGGAWKVAYADFVTAMMAFFLLMWLLGATTDKTRKGVADYFSPTAPIFKTSGGGNGAFGGDSTFTEQDMSQNGTGASSLQPTESNRARGEAVSTTMATAQITDAKNKVEKALTAFGGESMTMQKALRHVVTRITDEGLVIELFDLPETPLFADDSAVPEQITMDIAEMLAQVLAISTNQIAVNGHTKSYPITLISNPGWGLSSARAAAMRELLATDDLPGTRVQRVSGFADRKPVTADPMAVRNNRLEIILLRWDR